MQVKERLFNIDKYESPKVIVSVLDASGRFRCQQYMCHRTVTIYAIRYFVGTNRRAWPLLDVERA